jgi:hypothetical protein
MKRLLLIILLLPYAVSAATHYVKVNGSGDGSSWANAWGTIASVNSGTSGGDTVRFGTGNWFGSEIIPVAGTSSHPTVYSCSTFTTATQGLSKIWAGEVVTGHWGAVSGQSYDTAYWSPANTHGTYSAGGQNYPCVVAHDTLFHMVTSAGAIAQAGYGYYDYNNHRLYIWSYRAIDTVLAAARPVVLYDTNIDYTTFFGLDLKMGCGAAIFFEAGGCSNNLYSHCNLAHAITFAGNNCGVVGIFGDGGILYYDNTFRACNIYSATAGGGGGGDLAGNGVTTYDAVHTTFDSCYFSLAVGCGIHYKNCNDYQPLGENVESYCTFDGTNDMPFGLPTFTCAGVELTCRPDHDSIFGCTFINMESLEPSTGDRTQGGFAIEVNTSTASEYDYGDEFFCNNTMYNCNVFIAWNNMSSSMHTSGHQEIIKYNVGYGIKYTPFLWDMTNVLTNARADIDSNYWYDPSKNFAFWTGYFWVPNSINWTQWRARGFDTHSYNANPQFTDASAGNFSRPAVTEMNRTYGGRVWTKFGAVQGVTAPDIIPPSISNVRDSLVTAASASIFWSTGESTVKDSVLYGTTTACASKQVATNGASHRGDLTGLNPSTKYYFKVISYDVSDNDSTSALDSLTTGALDVTGPVIKGETVSGITSSEAIIGWTTDEPATSILVYGLTGSYGSIDSSQSLVTTHIKYLTGLNSSSLYHFRIRSRDSSGNTTQGNDSTFNTLAPAPISWSKRILWR